MDLQNDSVVGWDRQFHGIEVHTLEMTAVFVRKPPSRSVNQDPAHRLGSHRVKLLTILPPHISLRREPEPCLVNQRSCLQRLPRSFLSHPKAGYATEFVIH